MGAWGVGYFENDSALDWIDEIIHSEDAFQLLVDIAQGIEEYDQVEVDDACGAIVFGLIVASIVSRGKIEVKHPILEEWIKANEGFELGEDLKVVAIDVLKFSISNKSELKDLWFENKDLHQKWVDSVTQLVTAISAK
jgi:hypothetical protein